jgi:homoserine dehydrogenase
MEHYPLALLGFGNVGRALARLLLRKEEALRNDYGLSFSFTGIATGSKGRAVNPAGLDVRMALALVEGGESIAGLSTRPVADNFDFIAASEAQVLFEKPGHYASGQPAVDHLRAFLVGNAWHPTRGRWCGLPQLTTWQRHGALISESTVMDGARCSACSACFAGYRGVGDPCILNSTTNLMLRMEAGESLMRRSRTPSGSALETDPSGDIDG